MKKYISSKTIFIVVISAVVILVFWRIIYLWSFPDTSWILEKEDRVSLESKPILQKFVASRNNLSRIELFFSGSGIKPGGIITAKLLDENCAGVIKETKMKVTNLDSDNTYTFRFEHLRQSKNKIFCLSLSYQPFINNGKTVRIFINGNPPAESISLISASGEETEDKSLAIRPGYQAKNLGENVNELNQRISQYKPWFLKHYFLYFISFGFIFLSIFVVITLIRL